MSRASSLAILGLVGSLGACFGEGPEPTAPTDVTVVYRAPAPPDDDRECGPEYFIGDVTFGDTVGWAVTQPWLPPANCNSNGDFALPIEIHRFAKSGEGELAPVTPLVDGSQNNHGVHPRLAARGDELLWSLTSQPGSVLSVGGAAMASRPAMDGQWAPAGLVTDAEDTYLVGWNGDPSTDPNDPSYPCCGEGNPDHPLSPTVFLVASGALTPIATLPMELACTTTSQCVAQTLGKLFLVHRGDDRDVIASMSKQDGSVATVARLAAGSIPVGLAANDVLAAWAWSPPYDRPEHGCTIRVFDVAKSMERTLVDSTDFSCLGLAVDATHVYFTIVEVSDNGSLRPYGLRGVGIGRVSLAGNVVETLRHGIDAQFAGPRRIYLDNDHLYAVDPFAIARIAKTALDGRTDF